MINPDRYSSRVELYESMRQLFISLGGAFGVSYEGDSIKDILQKELFDKFDEEDINLYDVEVISNLYLSKMIEGLSLNIPDVTSENALKINEIQDILDNINSSISKLKEESKTPTIINNTIREELGESYITDVEIKIKSLIDTLDSYKEDQSDKMFNIEQDIISFKLNINDSISREVEAFLDSKLNGDNIIDNINKSNKKIDIKRIANIPLTSHPQGGGGASEFKDLKEVKAIKPENLQVSDVWSWDGTKWANTQPSANKLRTLVQNETGDSITNKVVYLSGVHGNRPGIALAQGNAESTSSKTYGMVDGTILDKKQGYVVAFGEITGLDTSMFAEGQSLWLSPTEPGGLTSTKPQAPNHSVFIGFVTRSHNNQGAIEVNIQNGYELDELHNVLITNPQNGQSLRKNGDLWMNEYSWEFLTLNWETEPSFNTTITGGDVFNYTYNSTTRYRFVPTVYNPTEDAFYADFDGTNLTNLIVKRG